MDGLLASMTVESPTDGDVFLAYLERFQSSYTLMKESKVS